MSDTRPNMIVILLDDMGFSDIGCYGSEIATPNIDALAAGGMRFTQFYNCARCCPTRASLLTGLYPHQTGIGFMEPTNKFNAAVMSAMPRPQYQGFLNDRCVTIAEALRPAGYQTLMAGKWHVGTDVGQRPLERGFDRYYGIHSGAGNYFRPQPWSRLHDGDVPVTEVSADFYTTDAFTTNAIRFIRESDAGRPFFLYLAYNAPHWPLQAWPDDIARYRGKYLCGWDKLREERLSRQKAMGLFDERMTLSPRDPESPPWETVADKQSWDLRMAVYAAMIDRVDQNIGRLMQTLHEAGRADNTMILFLSDNGACAEPFGRDHPVPPGPVDSNTSCLLPWANAQNTPFRLFKHWTHEGGIATPLVAHWPGHIPAGTINHRQVGHVKDIMATCLSAAEVEYPAARAGRPIQLMEGRSVLPALLDPRVAVDQTLFWEHEGNRAMRRGRWKLVCYYNEIREEMQRVGIGPRTGPWELYDLDADRAELHDLASRHPQILREMLDEYSAWESRIGAIDWEAGLRAAGLHQINP